MQLIKKVIFITSLIAIVLSCSGKKEDLKELLKVEKNIELALKSQDATFIETVISQIETVEAVFPEHQSLKERKYSLQIRIRKYNDAIETIDSLLKLSPEDIDNRIVKGILLEITGNIHQSNIVYEECLELINKKIEEMLKGDRSKKLGRELNRVMILKLLNRDSQLDYDNIKNDPDISDYPNILNLLKLMEQGSREQIINRYR